VIRYYVPNVTIMNSILYSTSKDKNNNSFPPLLQVGACSLINFTKSKKSKTPAVQKELYLQKLSGLNPKKDCKYCLQHPSCADNQCLCRGKTNNTAKKRISLHLKTTRSSNDIENKESSANTREHSLSAPTSVISSPTKKQKALPKQRTKKRISIKRLLGRSQRTEAVEKCYQDGTSNLRKSTSSNLNNNNNNNKNNSHHDIESMLDHGLNFSPTRYKKVYFSEKQTSNVSGIPGAPPCTPAPDLYNSSDFVSSLADHKAKNDVKKRLLQLEAKQHEKERIETKKALEIMKQAKDEEAMRKKHVQRLKIYAINKIMAEWELEQFMKFKEDQSGPQSGAV